MKLTKNQLKQLIKEELQNTISETELTEGGQESEIAAWEEALTALEHGEKLYNGVGGGNFFLPRHPDTKEKLRKAGEAVRREMEEFEASQ